MCTNKGCDPTQPIALQLSEPNVLNANYTGTVQFQMAKPNSSTGFRLVAWGEDQDHSPYDFSVTIQFAYAP